MKIINKSRVPIMCWADDPESSALDQAIKLANHPRVFHHVALAPDTHAGMGMPIGGIVGLVDAVSPNMVGADICCGMLAMKTDIHKKDVTKNALEDIVESVKASVPMGFEHQPTDKYKREVIPMVDEYNTAIETRGLAPHPIISISNAYSNIGTLGGGNHFIEIQHDEDGFVWVMIHSGSRNLGKVLGEDYNKIALKMNEESGEELPDKSLAFLPIESREGRAYLSALDFCVKFSFLNRKLMLQEIIRCFKKALGKFTEVETINIHHNYAALEAHFGKEVWVHRKGATLATKDITGIIPGSMGSSSYIVRGLGNPDSFMSCSHGAGRRMSRSQAKKTFTLEKFQRSMKGIVSQDVDKHHLDEAPMAYKDIDEVMAQQTDLVEVVHTLTPLANMKG